MPDDNVVAGKERGEEDQGHERGQAGFEFVSLLGGEHEVADYELLQEEAEPEVVDLLMVFRLEVDFPFVALFKLLVVRFFLGVPERRLIAESGAGSYRHDWTKSNLFEKLFFLIPPHCFGRLLNVLIEVDQVPGYNSERSSNDDTEKKLIDGVSLVYQPLEANQN